MNINKQLSSRGLISIILSLTLLSTLSANIWATKSIDGTPKFKVDKLGSSDRLSTKWMILRSVHQE